MLFCNIFVFQLTVLLTLVRDHYYSVDRGAVYCDERVSLSVCLRVCLSANISPELHARSSQFLSMLRLSLGTSPAAMRYVMYFHVMDAHIGQE